MKEVGIIPKQNLQKKASIKFLFWFINRLSKSDYWKMVLM